jgi:competence protein ComEC
VPLAFSLAAWPAVAGSAVLLALRGRTGPAAAALAAAFFVAGASWRGLDDRLSADDLSLNVGETQALMRLRARAVEVPLPPHPDDPDPRPGRLVLDIRSVERSSEWRPASGRAVLVLTGRGPEAWPSDLIELLATVKRPPRARTPGGFDRREVLAREGVRLEMSAPGSEVEIVSAGWALSPGRLAARLRARLARGMRVSLPRREAELFCGLLLGHRPGIDPADRELFAASGMGHLLAVSGVHLAILAGVVGLVLRKAGLGRRPTALSLACFAFFYAALAGGRTPVVRAAVMVAVYLGATVLGRDRDLPNTVAFAAFVLLVRRPRALFDPGFQLSFAAVSFIAFLYPILEEAHAAWRGEPERWMEPLPENRFERASMRVRQAVFISAAAWLGVEPLVLHHLGFVNPWAIASNVIVLPAAAIALASGVPLLVAGVVWLPLGLAFAPLARAGMFVLLAPVSFFSRLPGSVVHLPSPGVVWLLGYYSLALALFVRAPEWLARLSAGLRAGRAAAERMPSRRRMRIAVAASAAAGAVICLAVVLALALAERPPSPSVTVLDLGPARAALVRTEAGSDILVNAGSPGSPLVLRRRLRELGVGGLAAVVVTRDGEERSGGLGPVIEGMGADILALPAGGPPSESVRRAAQTARQRGGAVVWPREGDEIASADPARLLWTAPRRRGGPSLFVCGAGAGLDVALFDPGEESARDTAGAIGGGPRLPTGGVLVVFAGRGAARGLEGVIRALRPRVALVAVSRVQAAFPGPAACLRLLAREGVPVLRTDADGSVRVRTEGDGLLVERWDGRRWVRAFGLAADRSP